MSESIELKHFSSIFGKDSEIEEYHEIDEKAIFAPKTIPRAVSDESYDTYHLSTFYNLKSEKCTEMTDVIGLIVRRAGCNTQRRASKIRSKTITEEDFFTQYDIKSSHKKPGKKKQSKKKSTTNLMDIITSELANLSVPVTEELIINKVDHSKALIHTYLKNSEVCNLFKKPPCFLPEHGYGDKLLTSTLSPVYPKVLENAVTDYQPIPVQYMEAAKFEDVLSTNESDEGLSRFLDFTIKNIKFLHHHEMCLEELLCNKLAESFNEYRVNEKIISELLRDIKVNRETRDSLKEDFMKISSKKETIRFDETVRKYTARLFQLKDKYLEHLNTRKEIMHKIGSVWSDVIMIREKTGRVQSAYVLDIDRVIKDAKDYEEEWSEVFNIEYADKLDRLEYDYVTKYVEYKDAKENKFETKIKKPKLEFDEDVLKTEAELVTNKIVTKDKIEINLRQDSKIISDRRKSQIPQSKKYYFKIYVDDVFVCESDMYESNPLDKFKVELVESFSVQILPKNATMTIELYEQDEPVSYMKIILNKIKENSLNTEHKTESLVYNNIVEPNSKYVGSGHNIKEIAAENKVRLKSSNLFKGNLYTTCEISLQMGWNEKLHENEIETIKASMEVGRQLKRLMHGIDKPDIETLKNIIENIYEKDIGKDDEIINTLRNLCKMDVNTADVIPIDEKSPEFIRLKLLHLRNNGGFTSVENKMIPLLASQISTEQLNCLQKSTENEFDVQYYDNQDMDPIEIQRYIGIKYIEKLNKNMLKNLSEHLLKKTHKDVVRDFKDLSLRSLFLSQSNLAQSLSSSSRQQLITEALPKEQELRVSVFRALGLRDRSVPVVQNDDDYEKIAGFKIRPLRPFVRVSYHKTSEQTTPAIGCHPTWNQTLKIKTKFSPLSSIQVNIFDEQRLPVAEGSDQPHTVHYRCQNKWLGCLQVPVKTVLDMGMLKGTFKVSSPPFLLGYESAPKYSHSLIPEVTQMMKKEAAFLSLQITTSLSHLGGEQGYNQPVPADPDDYVIRHLNNFVTEYTNEFPSRNISLTYIDSTGQNKSVTQFLQPIPPPDYECFPKNPKSGSAMSKSSGRSSSSGRRKEAEERSELESIYSGFSGKADGMTKIMDACVRYVSLIPCYESTETRHVTLLGVELLKVLHGSPLDHAILLASYFLHIGLKCYIATGLGLPRGLSQYVLTKYDLNTHKMVLANDQFKSKFFGRNDGFVWYVYDAVSGEKFELRDVSCPLKTVDYVFDNENIWVNVQSSVDCESVSFDFAKSSDWQAVFDKSIFIMKLPVVTDTSLYSAAPASVENLRVALETRIKNKVQQWRPHVKTIWNRYCSTLLREVLPFWEYHAFNSAEQKPGIGQRLKQLMATHKMSGFPLNMPFVNMKSVISTIKATGIHLPGDPNAEFAIGVEVYPYPNNVLSVWVFLATITRI